MQKLILRNFQSPGDIVMLTAAVRDLHLTWMQDNVGCRIHGGEFADELTSWRRFGGRWQKKEGRDEGSCAA